MCERLRLMEQTTRNSLGKGSPVRLHAFVIRGLGYARRLHTRRTVRVVFARLTISPIWAIEANC